MPNWCFNAIEITNASDEFCKRLADLPKDASLFNSLYPSDNPYDDWGTRDVLVHSFLLMIGRDSTYFQGDTAWSPPIAFFQKMSEQYGISVKMYYEEPLMDFAGETYIENGEIIDRREYDYDSGVYKLRGFDEWIMEVDLYDATEENILDRYPYLQEDEVKVVLEKLAQV